MTERPAPGLQSNLGQVGLLLSQVFLVGATLGLTRTVVPALAESEFGVARGSVLLLASFVVVFGLVKAVLNFVAGQWSDRIGRKPVMIVGWVAALPVPVMIWAASGWGWIVAATVFLGISQGLTWSMSQTAKLDLTRAEERGLTMGLNEFAGYLGVALAGVATGYAAQALGARQGLLIFGAVVIGTGLTSAVVWMRESRPARPAQVSPRRSTAAVFAQMTWGDRRFVALVQAGLVEKFVDALVWILLPVFLYQRGLGLGAIGWVISAYGITWGAFQLVAGPLSDQIGRFWPNVGGMVLSGLGVGLIPLGDTLMWWAGSAGLAGLGMALLYPNLSAAIADLAEPDWRGTAIGVYRFWRDLGYAVGALALGMAASWSGQLEAAFYTVAVAMLASGGALWFFSSETHPRRK